jgi:shikimate kinase/3-dehydroquinate synthase
VRPALVFIGFMGAGKSTALTAARDAGLETTEIDALMEAELGMRISEAFERLGEEGFREREAEVVGALLEGADGGAIALGGGSVLSPRIRAALARHLVIWLQVGAEESWRRIAHSDRPLATSAEEVERLMAVREPLYEELADAIVPSGDRDIVRRALPSIQALAELPAGTRLLWATSSSGEYPVLVGRGLLDAAWWPLPGRRFCVSDSGVGPLYAERIGPIAGGAEVEPGESAKTLASAERVLSELARAGMTREDHLVALGGGVVGDLAGLCAHLYQRGVPVVQVPTTMVAQVDSAYGGKSGVDLPEGKNYAGAYQLPAAVLADTAALRTLPPAELAAGFVEALKTGLLAGGPLWERVRAGGGGGPPPPPPHRRGPGWGGGWGGWSSSPPPSSTTSSSPAPATSARWWPPTSATRACGRRSTSVTRSATRSRRRPATAATGTARRSASACWRRCGSPTRRGCARRPRPSSSGSTCRSRSTPRSTSTPSSTPCSATRSAPQRGSASSSSPRRASPGWDS